MICYLKKTFSGWWWTWPRGKMQLLAGNGVGSCHSQFHCLSQWHSDPMQSSQLGQQPRGKATHQIEILMFGAPQLPTAKSPVHRRQPAWTLESGKVQLGRQLLDVDEEWERNSFPPHCPPASWSPCLFVLVHWSSAQRQYESRQQNWYDPPMVFQLWFRWSFVYNLCF